MRRAASLALTVALVAAMLSVAGCQKKVEVRTGTRVLCTWGHAISNDTKVVTVPAKQVANYSVQTVTRVCERHAKLEALYREGQDALRAGKVAAAKKALTAVVAIDATYGLAKEQLDKIAAGKKPKPDANPPSSANPGGGSSAGGGSGNPTATPPGGSGATPPPTGGGNVSGPVDELRRWTPNTLVGFTASKPTVDVLNIARQYIPPDDSNILTLVIVAEQFRTSADAEKGLKVQLKDHYTKDRETVTVNGHSAFYGNDGRKFAALGFTDGSVMVGLEMSVKSGKPDVLRAPIIAVAKQLP